MKLEYRSIKDIVDLIKLWTVGKRVVVTFEHLNNYWVFTLDNGLRFKVRAIFNA